MKKEREHKKKQEALTIEETKAEIANTEAKLVQLKEEKHQLFQRLKDVLYEDDVRMNKRRSKEVSHPHMYLQTAMRSNPNAHMKPPSHLLMTQSGGSSGSALTAHALPPAQKRQRYVLGIFDTDRLEEPIS
jgi:hypothetical protein